MDLMTDTPYIVPKIIKDGVTIEYGMAVSYTDTDDEVALPAGDADTRHSGFSLGDGTGDDDAPVQIDIAVGGAGIPGIAGAAIHAGKTVVTKGTAGKVEEGTTAGAASWRAASNASGDGKRVWLQKD